MVFDLDKKNALSKVDKSKKGSIDEPIKKLCASINYLPNFYTTSSCSGRIVLLSTSKSGKKNESQWLLASHVEISFDDLKSALKGSERCDMFFRFEPPILHIACRSVEDASAILKLVYNQGFKRSGIISVGRKNIVEMVSTERIDVPLTKEGKLMVDDDYIAFLVEESNKKLLSSHKKLEKIFAEIKKSFSSM
jgi:tRNA wybutosine-synthesizing protein 3